LSEIKFSNKDTYLNHTTNSFISGVVSILNSVSPLKRDFLPMFLQKGTPFIIGRVYASCLLIRLLINRVWIASPRLFSHSIRDAFVDGTLRVYWKKYTGSLPYSDHLLKWIITLYQRFIPAGEAGNNLFTVYPTWLDKQRVGVTLMKGKPYASYDPVQKKTISRILYTAYPPEWNNSKLFYFESTFIYCLLKKKYDNYLVDCNRIKSNSSTPSEIVRAASRAEKYINTARIINDFITNHRSDMPEVSFTGYYKDPKTGMMKKAFNKAIKPEVTVKDAKSRILKMHHLLQSIYPEYRSYTLSDMLNYNQPPSPVPKSYIRFLESTIKFLKISFDFDRSRRFTEKID